jgi:hypothetical protein
MFSKLKNRNEKTQMKKAAFPQDFDMNPKKQKNRPVKQNVMITDNQMSWNATLSALFA